MVPRDAFLKTMRSVANSVAVVTTDGPSGRHGATVSSFCSVSADPPSMLVCLNAGSRIAQLVRDNGQFCANVLPQEMAQIADRFAGRMDATLADRFDGVAIQAGACGCPGIVGAVSLYCKVESEHLSGSHLVIIGQVRQIEGSIFRPLTHLDGSYWPWVN